MSAEKQSEKEKKAKDTRDLRDKYLHKDLQKKIPGKDTIKDTIKGTIKALRYDQALHLREEGFARRLKRYIRGSLI